MQNIKGMSEDSALPKNTTEQDREGTGHRNSTGLLSANLSINVAVTA